ncbi:5-hydroxytryptamine receptor 3B [Prionailurus iriomotensis]
MWGSEILVTDTPHPRNSTLYRLTKQLLQKYHKKVRPVHDQTEATMVYLDVFVHAVLDVDAQNQKLKTSILYYEVWDDEFLSWSPTMFDGIREISLPLSAIWAPDIIISDLEDVDLAFLRSREDIKHDKKEFLKDSEWELLSVSSTYNILQSNTGDFAQIQFNISAAHYASCERQQPDCNPPNGLHGPGQVVIRRRPLVYIMSLLIPSIFLVLVDLGSFYLPPTCRARIVFKTNVLVGYTVFRVNMSDEMPRSAVSTPLIGPAGVTEPSVCREHQAQSETLKEVSFQLKSISTYFQTWDQEDRQEVKWLAFLERFDRLLFKACLVVLGLYAVSLCSLWALGSSL